MPAAKKPKTTKTAAAAKTTEKPIPQIKGFVISKKRSGRYEVCTTKGKQVNGADKAKILRDAKLVAVSLPKAKEEAAEAPTT